MRICVAHPRMGLGGSEARTLWSVWALVQAGHEVTLLTTSPNKIDGLNRYYGTSLRAGDFVWQEVSLPLPGRGLHTLRRAWFERHCRALASRFDLFISAYNPMDLPVRSLQFVADFSWDAATRGRLDPSLDLVGFKRWARGSYERMTKPRRAPHLWLRNHRIVANSEWTATVLASTFGVTSCPVIYPPVSDLGDHPAPPRLAGDSIAFLWLGRVSPEKRLEDAIEILSRVRERGHAVTLTVAGDVHAERYGQDLLARHRQTSWIKFVGQVEGNAKFRLIRQHRFGLHTRPREPFGIAVAEMMKTGCMVFASADGGPADMLKGTPLLYRSPEGAPEVIADILRAPETWDSVSATLRERGRSFSVGRFCAEVTALVSAGLG